MENVEKQESLNEQRPPKVSVLMSVYKEPLEWIGESIDSILNQTFTDFELIIVNDNPEDIKLFEFLQNFSKYDNRILIITNQKNIGLTKSLNKAIESARGEYLARMDADDISLPDRFECQISYMDAHLECGVCGCNVRAFGMKNYVIHYPNKIDSFRLYFESPFAHPAVMIRKSVLDNNKIRYDESMKFSQDYDMWVRLSYVTTFANINQILLNYRISNQQITTARRNEQYKICTEIRTRAFNQYCEKNNLPLKLEKDIDYKIIKKFKDVSHFFPQEDISLLRYYLYRSVTCKYSNTIINFIISGDFMRFNIFWTLKVIASLTIFKKSNHFFQVYG